MTANRILLLHPEDAVPSDSAGSFDLIVDFGRAPASIYEIWGRSFGCRVMSISDLAEGTDDLFCTRALIQHGMNRVVDESGIDFWDLLVQSAVPDLQQLILLRRLAGSIGKSAQLFSTRPNPLADALRILTSGTLVELQSGPRMAGKLMRRVSVLQKVDPRQLAQVFQDKYDPEHKFRRRLARRPEVSDQTVVLLPSAYINVSRTAVAYADMVPDVNCLLVTARNSARLPHLPANVSADSLDGYFVPADRREKKMLMTRWLTVISKLRSTNEELELAGQLGIFSRMTSLLGWAVAVRNAWLSFFKSHNVVACLCADDSNPYSRLPLIIARNRGIPSIACHHGALDSRAAIKRHHEDVYLAKGEMERDYLVRVCRVAPETIVAGEQSVRPADALKISPGKGSGNLLVFFTEPYEVMGWRTDEIYRELLPRLVSLAKSCGLELVFKLHPFESERGHRRMLNGCLGGGAAQRMRILSGPIHQDFWHGIGCALTVQSTVAMDCSANGIPIFLCGWLADTTAGYLQQYERFGIGHVLRSAQEIDLVPQLMNQQAAYGESQPAMDTETLRRVLSGKYAHSDLISA